MSEKIESLISKEALAEFARLKELSDSNLASFEKLIAAGVQLNNSLSKAATFKEVVQNTKELTENDKKLTKQLDELTAANLRLQKAYEEQEKRMSALASKTGLAAAGTDRLGDSFQNVGAKLDKGLTKGFEGAIDKVVSLTEQLKKNKSAQKDLETQKSSFAAMQQDLPGVKEGLEQIAIKQRELVAEEKQLKASITGTNREIRNRIRENNSAPGTREEIKGRIISLSDERDLAVNIETEDGVKRLTEINEEIDRLNKLLEQTSDKLSKRKINIGNYEGAARIIVDAFEKANRKVVQVEKQFGSLSPEARSARREVEGLARIIDQPQFLRVSSNFGDVTQEAKFFQKQLNSLQSQGLGNTEAAKELTGRLAELADQLGDTRAEIKALSSDTRAFDLFASSVSFVASAFQAAAGAAIGLGASEEDTAEATKNLVAIENVANGVRGIANELTTRGTAANKVYAFAQLQVKTALDTTASSAVRLRAALFTVGIGALVVGVGLLIANFGKLKDMISRTSDEQKTLNQINEEAISTYIEEKVQVQNLVAEVNNENTSKRRKKEIIKELNEISPVYFGNIKTEKDLQDKLNGSVEKYIQAITLKAKAQAANAILVEKERKVIERQNELETELEALKTKNFGTEQKRQEYIRKFRDYIDKGADKELQVLQKNAAPIRKILADLQAQLDALGGDPKRDVNLGALDRKDQQAALDILKRRLQDEADFQKQLSESELVSLDARIAARNKAFDLEKRIILAQKAFDITEKELTEKQKQNIADEANSQIKKNAEANLNDLLGIYANFRQKQKEMFEADVALAADLPANTSIEEQIAREEMAFERRSNYLEEGRDILIRSLEAEKNAKLLAAKTDEDRQKIEEKYNKKRVLIELQTNAELLQASLDLAEKKLLIAKKSGNENQVADLLKQIADLKRKLEELKGVKINIDADEAAEKLRKLAEGVEKFGRIALDIFSAIGGIISGNIDREKNAIQDQMDAVDKKKEKDIEAVNAQAISEEDKANKIAIINARAQAQREALERRQRQLDQQKAKFDKARAITEAIINTSVAVIKALPNLALAAVVGGIGALQLAAIIATPIPKFATGTDDAPGGLSLVGDGGKKELVVTPDGRLMETPSIPTIMNIPKHSVIHPDSREVMEAGILSGMRSLPSLVDHRAYYREMTGAITGEIKTLGKIIKNKSEVHIHKRREGWGIMKRQGGNQQTFLNNNLQ